jgi:hypothetical protein
MATATTMRRAIPTARRATKAALAIARISARLGAARSRIRRRPAGGRLVAFAAGSGTGMAVGYLLDPAEGKRRRHVLRDQAMAKLRRGSRQAGKRARYMRGKAKGVVAEATPGGFPLSGHDGAERTPSPTG